MFNPHQLSRLLHQLAAQQLYHQEPAWEEQWVGKEVLATQVSTADSRDVQTIPPHPYSSSHVKSNRDEDPGVQKPLWVWFPVYLKVFTFSCTRNQLVTSSYKPVPSSLSRQALRLWTQSPSQYSLNKLSSSQAVVHEVTASQQLVCGLGSHSLATLPWYRRFQGLFYRMTTASTKLWLLLQFEGNWRSGGVMAAGHTTG